MTVRYGMRKRVSTLRTMSPVSYTHLDVYKRQGDDEGASRNTQGDSRAVAEAEVDQAKNDAQGEAEAQGKQVRLCLLYTSRCV